jgi:hypothetical protein
MWGIIAAAAAAVWLAVKHAAHRVTRDPRFHAFLKKALAELLTLLIKIFLRRPAAS